MTKRALVSLVIATVSISSCGIQTGRVNGVSSSAEFGSEAETRYYSDQAAMKEVRNNQNAKHIDAETREAIDNAVQNMD